MTSKAGPKPSAHNPAFGGCWLEEMERLLYSASAQSPDSPSSGFRIGRFTAQLTMPDATDHLWWHLRCSRMQLDNVVVFAWRKAVRLTTRRSQVITTANDFDVRPDPGSSTRSR